MTTVIENKTPKERLIASLHENMEGRSVAPDAIRQNALTHLAEIDFPTTKNEEWKYSNIKPILDQDFSVAKETQAVTAETINNFVFSQKNSLLVFINGFYSKEHSRLNDIPSSCFMGSLAACPSTHKPQFEKHFGKYTLTENEAFTALNTAYSNDGAFVYISENAQIESPVQLLFITSTENQALIVQPRILIVAEKNSRVNILETYYSMGTEKSFTNAVTEIRCDENSSVEHYKIQLENNSSFHIGTTLVHQERSSLFNSFVFTLDGGFVRNNLTTALDATGVETHLFGLYLPNKNQHIDNHTLVDHKKPYCNSNELYKGIIDDTATGVFNGKIFVRKDAQKTNAFQSNKNILLSDFAKMNSKPQLEIFADDVKCSHGSTTGQFDEDALFYMRARGIGEEKAKNLLMHAFASEIIEAVKIPNLKGYLYKLLSARLKHDFRE
jgi:Fe-S cluster assembly protein SufD